MDKFMPKTIEQLNAEFEARMEKAKQDELNAAAEKAAAEKHEKPRKPAQQPKQKRLRKRDALKSAAMTAR